MEVINKMSNLNQTRSVIIGNIGSKDLARELWKHCYRTTNSCEGHGSQAHIMFSGGDGWFEEKAPQYGFKKYTNNP